MRSTKFWEDYELLDCSDGERLERWGDIILIRPDPQVIWKTPKKHPAWENAHARYVRPTSAGGQKGNDKQREIYKSYPDEWNITYKDLKFKIKPIGFKHTGLFPEQAVNWDLITDVIKGAEREVNVLNLFAYTGGATIAALKAGASVVHVDASKGIISHAKENAKLSGVIEKPVRWIVDDCEKFVNREIKRGNKYDIVIMDPPSFGRGPGGEIWQLENKIHDFIELIAEVLSDEPLTVFINSYTTGVSPSVMKYILGTVLIPKFGGNVFCDEIGLEVTQTGLHLPCGATAIWSK
ncbi:MAG: SAM-dependent methyltransferase [Ruminococcaceae bacterium]|nr:SAM-dependent methyltransferase [Oscillospiraceae bacterium]